MAPTNTGGGVATASACKLFVKQLMESKLIRSSAPYKYVHNYRDFVVVWIQGLVVGELQDGFFLDDSSGVVHVSIRPSVSKKVSRGDHVMVVGPVREHSKYGRDITGYQVITFSDKDTVRQSLWPLEVIDYWTDESDDSV